MDYRLKNQQGHYYIVTTSSPSEDNPIYKNFTMCNAHLQEMKKDAQEREDAGIVGDMSEGEMPVDYYDFVPNEYVMENALKSLLWFERNYKCSGICNPGLFYYSLDLSESVPEDACLLFLKTEIGDSLTFLGVTSIICGVLMCLVFVFQYMLWCPPDEESGDSKNNRHPRHNTN